MASISRAIIRDKNGNKSRNQGYRCEGRVGHGQKTLHQCFSCLRQYAMALSSNYVWPRHSKKIRSFSVGDSLGETADRRIKYLLPP